MAHTIWITDLYDPAKPPTPAPPWNQRYGDTHHYVYALVLEGFRRVGAIALEIGRSNTIAQRCLSELREAGYVYRKRKEGIHGNNVEWFPV
jgi:hypothetical protein